MSDRRVCFAKSSSQMGSGEIDVNAISKAASKQINLSNLPHVIYQEPDPSIDQSVSIANIDKTLDNPLSVGLDVLGFLSNYLPPLSQRVPSFLD